MHPRSSVGAVTVVHDFHDVDYDADQRVDHGNFVTLFYACAFVIGFGLVCVSAATFGTVRHGPRRRGTTWVPRRPCVLSSVVAFRITPSSGNTSTTGDLLTHRRQCC